MRVAVTLCAFSVAASSLLARYTAPLERLIDARRPPLAAAANARASAAAAAPKSSITYAAWPPPQRMLSRETATQLGIGTPGALDAGNVSQALLALGRERAARGAPPPVLVVVGGRWMVGLGNVISAIASAAVTAEAIGAACIVSLGDLGYISKLRRRFARSGVRLGGAPLVAFPCVEVGEGALAALRAAPGVPIVAHGTWRAARFAPPPAGPFLIDLGRMYEEKNCATRADIGGLIAPPGLAPAEWWARYREKVEELLLLVFDVPRIPAEHTLAAPAATLPPPRAGALCGHARLRRKEVDATREHSSSADACADSRPLLRAMEAMHAARPFGTYLIAAGADMSACVRADAPRLHADARQLATGHASAKISTGGMLDFSEDDSADVLADLRALSRCAVVLVDDKPGGSFALAAAAAGRLAPCADPLAWWAARAAGRHDGAHADGTLDGAVDLNAFAEYNDSRALLPARYREMPLGLRVRALCKSADAAAPALVPFRNGRSAEALQRAADDAHIDVSRPWWPQQLPRAHRTAMLAEDDRARCERQTALTLRARLRYVRVKGWADWKR